MDLLIIGNSSLKIWEGCGKIAGFPKFGCNFSRAVAGKQLTNQDRVAVDYLVRSLLFSCWCVGALTGGASEAVRAMTS